MRRPVLGTHWARSKTAITCLARSPQEERQSPDPNRLVGDAVKNKAGKNLRTAVRIRRSMRSPFPGWVPKALKLHSPRTAVPIVPAHIRVLGTSLSKNEKTAYRQALGWKLGKLGRAIERVSVRVTDVNGPRGGIDQVCRIKVVLTKLPSVLVEAQNASLDVAFRTALRRMERALRRSLQRRRMKARKFRARSRARVD